MNLPWRRIPGGREVLLLCFALGDEFLSHRLFPDASRLRVGPESRHEDLAERIPARCRVAIQCLNLSEPRRLLPADSPLRHALARRGIPLLNGTVGDLTKRGLRAALSAAGLATADAGPDGPPDELLIVKANYNSGAQIERGLDAAERDRLALPEIPAYVPGADHYQVMPRHAVPAAAFADPFLIVERFLPRDDHIVFRIFVGGPHAQLCIRRSQAAVARGGNSQVLHNVLLVESGAGWEGRLPPVPDLPAVLAAGFGAVRAANLHLGSLDVVTDSAGQAFVIDVNATAHCGSDLDYGRMMIHLREGVGRLINTPASNHSIL